MIKNFTSLVLVCTVMLVGYAHHLPSLAQSPSSSRPHVGQAEKPLAPTSIACSPDRPIVFPRETISLKAWTNSCLSQNLQYTWSSTAGQVDSQGFEARWDFTGVRPGTYRARVHVSDQKNRIAECSVQVIVRSRLIHKRGGKRETGRSFLLPEQAEAEGYGLYSYLLLGSRPSDAARERYLKAIIEYLRFPDVIELEQNIQRYHRISRKEARRKLNITYLPVKIIPGREILKQLAGDHYTEVAEWVLAHYDYERARVLLSDLPGDHQKGPYLLSFLKSQSGTFLSPPYLYQDQSWVPPHLVNLWMKEFLNQAAQEHFWEERTGKQLVLNLRTTVGILAIGLPEVQKALNDLIDWVG